MTAQTGLQDRFVIEHLPGNGQQPQYLFDLPQLHYPEKLNSAVELIDRHVQQGRGQNIALRWLHDDGTQKQMTYQALALWTNQLARVLTEDLGLVSGNRLLLRGPNNVGMAGALLACLKAGIVAVPTMPLLRARELSAILKISQAQAALCDERLLQELEHCRNPDNPNYCPTLQQIMAFGMQTPDSMQARADTKSDAPYDAQTLRDDPCMIAFTSGTTGKPKGCIHFHRDVLAMCDTFSNQVLQTRATDIACGTPPLAFTFGLGGLLCFPLRVGGSTLLVEKLTPDAFLQIIQDHKVTMTFTAPTFYRKMAGLAEGYSLDSLRVCVSAGEALPDDTRQIWKKASGINMTDGIGGTEMMHVYISSTGSDIRDGAIGRVVPGYQARVVDADMNEVPPGTLGRLAVRGPTGCRYLDDERQSRYVQQQWNLPGDAFVMDADGYFYYRARDDDMIVSAGYNIAGPEVESVLMTHAAVNDCGVVGRSDAERGAIVKAYIVLNDGFTPGAELVAELQDYVKQEAAPYKYPREIEFVEQLPRTETGKLQRFVLRKMTETR
ncbi:AMP-binding protein [Advenella kashmirensis]